MVTLAVMKLLQHFAGLVLSSALFYYIFILFFPICVCAHVCMCTHVCVCLCMWRPKVDIGSHHPSLLSLIYCSSGFSVRSRPRGMASLPSHLAVGIACLCLHSWSCMPDTMPMWLFMSWVLGVKLLSAGVTSSSHHWLSFTVRHLQHVNILCMWFCCLVLFLRQDFTIYFRLP